MGAVQILSTRRLERRRARRNSTRSGPFLTAADTLPGLLTTANCFKITESNRTNNGYQPFQSLALTVVNEECYRATRGTRHRKCDELCAPVPPGGLRGVI